VVSFVQPYQPAPATLTPTCTTGSVIAGAVLSPSHTVRPAPSSTHTAGPASKLGPGLARAAYSRLLEQFPAVVSHDVVHHIVTHEQPITSKFRKLDSEKLAATKSEFNQLEEESIIQRSTLSSPIHLVRKLDGGWRPYGDFRRLNLVTKPDVYPLQTC
jgi:hypothetical protein